MSELSIDLASAAATAKSVSGLVDDMEAAIARVRETAAQGVAAWRGAASTSFDGTHGDWNASAVKLQQALREIEAKLTSGFSGYEDHDAQGAQGFKTGATLNL